MALRIFRGEPPNSLGLHEGHLAPCPPTPNCVSSLGCREKQSVEPFLYVATEKRVWKRVAEQVERLPRTRIVAREEDYLHAECSTRLFGFVDDLELHFQPDKHRIDVRSASRLGRSDLGVNRRRVETLRGLLSREGLLAFR